ncbi:MAG: xanthine dehydrogenase family protein subunit M [Proteobacteria bacterium]|nr:xanthine dehydrogenase family protein subunit M [Pseudomonadota bacterium]
MKPAPFDYEAPTTIADALKLLGGHEDARPIAGGQSLVPMLAFRLARPSLLVDLNRIPSLAGIEEKGGVLRIGAMTRQAAVLASDTVKHHAPLLIQALENVGHPPTRARGTIGGSCAHADPAAELPSAMVALDATMVIAASGGERRVPADDFFIGAFETVLQTGEILVALELPKQTGGSAFLEVSARKGDFGIVTVAARIAVKDGRCTDAALVLGGITERSVRCAQAEHILKEQGATPKAIDVALAALPLDTVTMDSRLASAAYRRRLIPELCRRAIEAATTSKVAL